MQYPSPQKRHWLFPLALILLTVALIGLVLWRVRGSAPPSSVVQTAPTQEEYRTALALLVHGFEASYAASDTDAKRLDAVEGALRRLLDVRVPAPEKDLHLDLAVALNQMRNGLRGEKDALIDGRKRLDAILARTPFLR